MPWSTRLLLFDIRAYAISPESEHVLAGFSERNTILLHVRERLPVLRPFAPCRDAMLHVLLVEQQNGTAGVQQYHSDLPLLALLIRGRRDLDRGY